MHNIRKKVININGQEIAWLKENEKSCKEMIDFHKRSISRFENELKIIRGIISRIEWQPCDADF